MDTNFRKKKKKKKQPVKLKSNRNLLTATLWKWILFEQLPLSYCAFNLFNLFWLLKNGANLNLQYFLLLSLSGAVVMRTICFCRVTEQCKLCYMLCYGFSPFPSSPEIFFNSWHTTVRFQVAIFPAVVGAGSLSPPRLQSCSPAT